MIKQIILTLFILLPNLNAQTEIRLNGEWQFAIDSLNRGIEEKWFTKSFKNIKD